MKENISCRHCEAFENSTLKECLPSTLDKLLQIKKPLCKPKGSSLFREGEPVTDLFCQYSGEITLSKENRKGKSFQVRTTGPGEMIEMKTLLNGEEHCTTAEATTDVQVCAIPKKEFLELVTSDQRLYLSLIRKICTIIEAVETRMKKPA